METNVYVTDTDMMEHIGHRWEVFTEGEMAYLGCDCGDIITSCRIPYWYTAGHQSTDDLER